MQSAAKHPLLKHSSQGISRRLGMTRRPGNAYRPCCHAERSEASPSQALLIGDSSQARNDREAQHLHPILCKISPFRIHTFHKRVFLSPTPAFDLFLSLNSCVHMTGLLKIYERIRVILGCKSRQQVIAMLIDPTRQIIRHPCIQYVMMPVCYHIYVIFHRVFPPLQYVLSYNIIFDVVIHISYLSSHKTPPFSAQ
jgi:hypothetical protein